MKVDKNTPVAVARYKVEDYRRNIVEAEARIASAEAEMPMEDGYRRVYFARHIRANAEHVALMRKMIAKYEKIIARG